MIDSASNPQIITREFPSWVSFIQSSANDSNLAWPRASCSSRKEDRERKEFTGTYSFQEAYDMATRLGWPEGRKLLREAYAVVAPKPSVYNSYTLDVAGMIPLSPVFAAGDPAHMMDFGHDLRLAKPIVRIDYHSAVLSNIPTKSIMLRGAAVLSLARDLEAQGYSTELRIVSCARAHPYTIRVGVVFKQAGENLDLDRAAFAIAHPSVQRRFIFSIREQHLEIFPYFRGSYGRSTQQPIDPTSGQPGGAIFISGASEYETPDSARLAVEIASKDLLIRSQRESSGGYVERGESV